MSSAAQAQTEKDKGNAAFKVGDFPTAIGHYTAAFIADPSNATYPLNRAAAYLKLGKNEDAERDCDTVLRLDQKNVKGYFRRGQARVALQKLKEAEIDFNAALKLEPKNDSVKQELKKIQDALRAVPAVQKTKKPIDISAPLPSSTPPTKRRRVPISIVEPEVPAASSSDATSSVGIKDSSLLTPISSRPIERTSSEASTAQPSSPSSSHTTTTSSQSAPPKPQTFREAKAAREEARPRGGIFRSDGRSSLFYAPSSSNGEADVPKRETPQTLVSFMRIWETLQTDHERWDVLRQIPATRLPVLFKTSLDASILASVLRTLRAALTDMPEDQERARIVRAYMVNLPRVPRFKTLSMMMDANEMAHAQVIWDLLGRTQSEGVEGEMDKRKEDGSRTVWGCY